MGELEARVAIERKHEGMAAFVVVPASKVAPWKLSATTTVEGTLDGIPLGRRSLHRWDERRWFVELRRDHLEALGKGPGDRADLVLRLASAELPAELQALIASSPKARENWESCTAAQQRMLREEILAAKAPATRERRARRALLPVPPLRPPPVEGLPSEPRAIRVRIVGRRLPGRSCGPYDDISVGLVQKAGCGPAEPISADARGAEWETEIQVRDQDGLPAFRGPAVNGPQRERFLYLTWIGRKGRAAPAMFRRAKLRLDAVPAGVLAKSLESGVLVGTLDLTAADGTPLCASVRPPAITWSSPKPRRSR
jgi:hypothetical protein